LIIPHAGVCQRVGGETVQFHHVTGDQTPLSATPKCLYDFTRRQYAVGMKTRAKRTLRNSDRGACLTPRGRRGSTAWRSRWRCSTPNSTLCANHATSDGVPEFL